MAGQPVSTEDQMKSQMRAKLNLKRQVVKLKVLMNGRPHKRKSENSKRGTTSSLLDSDSSLASSNLDSPSAFSRLSRSSASESEISYNGEKHSGQCIGECIGGTWIHRSGRNLVSR